MIKVQKQQAVQPAVIRSATENELSNYEKTKLAGIEEKAQQNKLESIRLNGARLPIDQKTVNINVGDLAFKSVVTSNDIDSGELFFIRCSLD